MHRTIKPEENIFLLSKIKPMPKMKLPTRFQMNRSNPKHIEGNIRDKVKISWNKARDPTGRRGGIKHQKSVWGKQIRLSSKPKKESKKRKRGANKTSREDRF